jgi:hypothetical protein
MTFDEYKVSIQQHAPPLNLSEELKGLWWDGKGSWDKSHETVQDMDSENAAWVHAYLHRKEGDVWNADYWYRRAGKVRPKMTLDEEWEHIVKALLD